MILFINSIRPQCGVYQYGLRLFSQLNRPDVFEYAEIGSYDEFVRHIQSKSYSAFIVNYHPSLFSWWQPQPNTYYLHHENTFPFEVDRMINTDPTHPRGIPRPLFQGKLTSGEETAIPTFGSFGFGFHNKGYERILEIVQSQYDDAIVRFLIPYAHYGDQGGELAREVVNRCRSKIAKPGIKLIVAHDFLPNEDVVAFLASNTLNIFLYDHMPGRGCSSVIDYALAAGKPIAISDSTMFRHIYSDAICAYRRPLRDIIADGDQHIRPFLEKWNPETLCSALLRRVDNVPGGSV